MLGQYSTALNSALLPGDAVGLNASTVPDSPRELSFGQLWYDAPLGADGTRFGISAGYGEIHPSDHRRDIGTKTISEIVEARFTTVPVRTRRSSLWLTASATLQNVSETETAGTIYEDRLRLVGIRADYQAQDAWGGWNYLTLGFRQGLDVFDASPEGSALLSRADGSAAFSRVEFSFTRIQKLSEVWSVRFASAGQWASRPLLGSQEFNLGGRIFGLGVDTGLIGGDHGVGALLELRYDQKLSNKYLQGYQLFAFLDGGTVRNILPGRDWVGSISSAGIGARLYFPDDLLAEIGIAFPLSHTETIGAGNEARVFFSVSKAFKTCPERPYWQCS
jgi:hemolysin activation/secretion protein